MTHDPSYITRYANQDIYSCKRCGDTGIESDGCAEPRFSKPCDDYPILDMDGEKDERFPDVVLLEKDGEDKQTAEDRGDHFWVADWELHELEGQRYWFQRSGYTISRDLVALLHSMTPGNSPAPGGAHGARK